MRNLLFWLPQMSSFRLDYFFFAAFFFATFFFATFFLATFFFATFFFAAFFAITVSPPFKGLQTLHLHFQYYDCIYYTPLSTKFTINLYKKCFCGSDEGCRNRLWTADFGRRNQTAIHIRLWINLKREKIFCVKTMRRGQNIVFIDFSGHTAYKTVIDNEMAKKLR